VHQTTLPEFTVGGNDVWNGYGEVVVLDDAFRSGFRMATPDAAATPIVARATQGRSNAAVIFNPSTDAIRGQLRSASTGVRFWAKVESGSAPAVYALVGGAARGTVALTVDGAWHEYLLSFGSTWSGQELILLGSANGTAKFLLDDVGLTLPPPPPVVTVPPTPPTYYVPRTVIDWRVRINCLSFQNADGTGPITYSCNLVTLDGTAPVVSLDNPTWISQQLVGLGGVEEYPYGSGVYGKSHIVQDWVQGPPPVTVAPAPRYVSSSVKFGNDYGNGVTIDVLFGTPPPFQFVQGMGATQIRNAIADAGGVETSAGVFTFYSSTPPATTIPPQTTTTVAVVTTTTTPIRPAPFTSYPNYLRSQKLKNDGVVAQCLMPGASSIQSFAAGCDSVTALLAFVWDAAAQGYLVKQGGACLQVDYNAPDPQVLLPGGAPAAKVGWVTCGSTGPGAVWVPTFVETDASGAGWYQLIPNARPGVPTPCLNLNLGASQSTQMLVEYNCQGGTHTEERWAPNESFWTAPGGTGGTGGTDGGVTTTTTPINPPVGAHLLTIDVPTLIKSSSDLACLSIQENSTYAFEPQGSDTCQFFDPALVAGSPGGIILRQIENETQCLGHSGLLITLIPCVAVGAIWNDPPDADGLRFGLNLMIDGQKYCAFLQGSVFALSTQCDSVNPSFLFYDDKPSLPGSVNLQDFYDLKNKITIVKPNGEALRARVIRIAGRARSSIHR
jgi:hypothetical protein